MPLSTPDIAIRIQSIHAGYIRARGVFSAERITIINGVSFALKPGEIVGLLGDNAAGKSTLIRAIIDPDARWAGNVSCNGEPLRPGQVAYVPQAAGATLSPWQTVEREIALSLRIRGWGYAKWVQHVRKLPQEHGMPLPLDRKVGELSGGQRMKVALLRALAMPDIRLGVFDEPFENLDEGSRSLVARSIRKLSSRGIPIVVTSHREMDLDMLGARRLLLVGAPVHDLQNVSPPVARVFGTMEQDGLVTPAEEERGDEASKLTAYSTRRGEPGERVLGVLGVLAGIIIWSLAALAIRNVRLLPPPWRVATEMIRFLGEPGSTQNVAATIFRAFGWWLVANLFAVPIGIVTGYSTRFYRLASPWLSLGRCLPIFVLLGVARGLFSGQEWLQVGFLIWLTLFLVALQSVSAAAALTSRSRLEIARLFGASHFFRLTRIMPFESFPGIIAALEITLPLAVIVTLVVESFTFPPHGLGLDIYNNMDKADLSKLFAAILLPGIVAAVFTLAIRRIAKRIHASR